MNRSSSLDGIEDNHNDDNSILGLTALELVDISKETRNHGSNSYEFEPSINESVHSIDPLQPNKLYDDDNDDELSNARDDLSFTAYVQNLFKQLWLSQILVFKYVLSEAYRHKRSFLTGWFTVFLVVLFVSLLLNSVTKSPVIFFKLAENSVGENDLVLTPGYSVDNDIQMASSVLGFLPLLNHSIINNTMNDVGISPGTTPRWVLIARVSKPSSTISSSAAVVLGIDTRQEAYIGYGRQWDYPELGTNEVVLSRTIIRQLLMDPNTAIGDTVTVGVGFADILEAFGGLKFDRNNDTAIREALLQLSPQLRELYNMTIPITLNTNNLPFGLNLSSILNAIPSAVNASNSFFNITDLTVNNLLQLVEEIFEPILNVTLNLNRTAAQELIDNFEIPGVGNITRLLQEIVDSINDSNGTEIQFNVTLGPLFDASMPFIIRELSFSANVIIRGVVDDPLGKWPAQLGSVVVMDTQSLLNDIREQFDNIINIEGNLTEFRQQIRTLTNFDIVNDVGLTNDTLQLWKRFWSGENILDPDGQITDTVHSIDSRSISFLSIVQHINRLKIYIDSLETMHRTLIQFSNVVAGQIGLRYPATFTMPIDTSLQETQFLRYFLDNIFGATIALVVVLGMMLIYALLLNDIQERNYEYGMLRALGMKQRTLIQLLITKSLLFAIPGIGIGLLMCYMFNIPIAVRMANFAVIPVDYSLSSNAIIISICIGFIMPLVANIVPISRALSRTLRDSLDLYHQVVNDIIVRVERLANVGVDLWQSALGLLLVVVGFITYYLIPYAFTFRKFGIFLGILNAILLGMLFGLCLMASIVQPYLEKIVLQCILWGNHRRLLSVIRKNLAGHRHRNKKTAQMFTVCLAFIIFAGVMFALQARSLSDNVRVFFGSDILISAISLDDALNEDEMSAFLNEQVVLTQQGRGIVMGFTFMTFSLRQTLPIRQARVANLPGYPSVRNFVFGVQENYLDVAYDEFYMPTSVASTVEYPKTPNGKDDAIKIMWTDAGNARLPEEGVSTSALRIPLHVTSGTQSINNNNNNAFRRTKQQYQNDVKTAYSEYIDVIVSEALRNWMSITIRTPLSLRVRYQNPKSNDVAAVQYLCKPRALARKVPGFFFSSYAPTAFFSSVIIKEEHFKRILDDANEWAGTTTNVTSGAPKMRLLIKTSSDATCDQREDIINSLRPFFKSDATIALDTANVIASVKTAVELLNLFFTIVGVIAMILCFFILWLSFTANVRENAWEFGVLRAVGLNSNQVVMVYIYEALSLVLTSLLLGTSIGIIIAVSLTLQFNLFTEMPFHFEFPHLLFWTVTSMALIVAVVASYLPAYTFMKHSVAHVLRHT